MMIGASGGRGTADAVALAARGLQRLVWLGGGAADGDRRDLAVRGSSPSRSRTEPHATDAKVLALTTAAFSVPSVGFGG